MTFLGGYWSISKKGVVINGGGRFFSLVFFPKDPMPLHVFFCLPIPPNYPGAVVFVDKLGYNKNYRFIIELLLK